MVNEYCVIGNGLLGAAIALELAYKSEGVCILGAAYGQEGRYYSSHEDDSRIARCWHSDAYWEDLARRNVAKLQTLGGASALPVFRRTPVFYSYPSGFKPSSSSALTKTSNHNACASRFEYEDICGGIIEPKIYIAALNQEARRHKATVVQCAVQGIRWKDGKAIISTSKGEMHSKRVIEARGVHFDRDAAPSGTTVVGKILLYIEAARQLSENPFCFVDSRCSTDLFEDLYGIVDYKSVRNAQVSKFGFSEREPLRLNTAEEISAWFQTTYQRYPHNAEAERLVKGFCDGETMRMYTKPCAFVTTPDKRPVISLDENHASITGCNGMAAKSCQALAEQMVTMWNV